MCWSGVGEALAGCAALLEPVLGTEPDRSLGSVVDEELLLLADAERMLDAIKLRLLAAHDAEDLGAREGFPSTMAWWACRTGRRRGTAAAEVALARRAFGGDLAATGQRLGAGAISQDQAQAIHRGTKGLPADAVPVVEAVLLESSLLTPEDLATVAETAKARLRDTEALEAAYERQQAMRSLTLTPVGDMYFLQGLLAPDVGRKAAALLDVLAKPRPLPDGSLDDRVAAQRRHDALGEILAAAARAQAPDQEVPHRSATLTQVVLDVSDVRRLADPQTPQDHVARRECCDTDLTWTLVDRGELPQPDGLDAPTGELLRQALSRLAPALGGIKADVLDQGRRKRDATPAQRLALWVRDGGCVFPGCKAPPGWCDVHHLIHWINWGLTNLINLALLCPFHHGLVHDKRWTLTRRPDGTWLATPPRPLAQAG